MGQNTAGGDQGSLAGPSGPHPVHRGTIPVPGPAAVGPCCLLCSQPHVSLCTLPEPPRLLVLGSCPQKPKSRSQSHALQKDFVP